MSVSGDIFLPGIQLVAHQVSRSGASLRLLASPLFVSMRSGLTPRASPPVDGIPDISPEDAH